jgi:hypothetical protein
MKRPSSISMRLVMGSIAVGLAAIVVLVMRQSGHPEGPAAQTAAVTATAPAPKAQAITSPPEIQSDDVRVPEMPEMPDDVIERILREDKKLALFMDHYRTVLPDKQKRDEYRKLLSDPAMMHAMAEELMNPGSGHPKPEEYYRRLIQIDYFEEALAWKDNPQREKLVELTRDMITKDNFQTGQDSARREILGGTKMELYHLLYDSDAQKAGELVAQARGTRMEPLVNWMAQEELRRRAEEKDLKKKIDELSRTN